MFTKYTITNTKINTQVSGERSKYVRHGGRNIADCSILPIGNMLNLITRSYLQCLPELNVFGPLNRRSKRLSKGDDLRALTSKQAC